MDEKQNRERVIRAAWEERGRAEWDPETHGRALLPLHISANVRMTPVRPGAPLPLPDELEFRLVRATMGGQPINSIVCEGVVVETIEGGTPPGTGWMNSSDDATNQVVQIAAANQRRNMAAISLGESFVPPPQEVQPVALSAASLGVAQGRATLTVTFADKEAVAGWLSGQTDDAAVVFAARAALRVLPTIIFSEWPGTGRRTTPEIVSRVFRAMAAGWAVAAYPGQRDALNGAARAALSGLGDLKAPSPIRAAAYAAATATGETGAPSRASTVIGYALDAVGSKGREAFELFLEALATDAGLLHDRLSAANLAHSKLWPSSIPNWVRDDWGELRATLLGQNQDWDVWTGWYDERLAGDLPHQEIQIARARIDDAIWQQGAAVVNAHIKELITEREIFEHATEDERAEPPDDDAIPRQTAMASQFAIDSMGRLDLLPDAPVPDDAQRDIYQEVRIKTLELAGLGHNQLADLSEPISRFLEAAPERLELASITRLWSRGNSLRLRLKAHEVAASLSDRSDPALMPPLVAETLRDLVETYNVFIVGDPAGRELDRVRLGPQEREVAKATIDLAVPIAEAVQGSDGLATAAAIEAFVEQIEAARSAPPGVDGDQAIDLSRKTASNFVAELLRGAYARIRAETGFAWKEIRAGTYRYAVPGLIVGGYVPPIIRFVVEHTDNLKLFAQQTFNNPTLVQIIDLISKVGNVP
jgi:hypothetical protein